MALFNGQASTEEASHILELAREKGVRLWSEDGELRYKAPKGILSEQDIDRLRASRGQLVALLEAAKDNSGIGASGIERAPLAFSQLAHWHLYQLHDRRASRAVASAVRIRGPLDTAALATSVEVVVRRHFALRTRIVIHDGAPMQEILASAADYFEQTDLSALSEICRELEIRRLIDEIILEPVDVAVGPLFAARLLRLGPNEHLLIVAMEHIISDGFSLNILTRDLFAAYTRAVRGLRYSWPTMPLQFVDYALWQRQTERSWVEKHAAYWDEHLSRCPRIRFPQDSDFAPCTHSRWGSMPFRIGGDRKAKLREWSRQRHTTVVMTLFAAYASSVLRWCDVSEAVLQFQSDGRYSPEVENTIGYFAAPLYLRVQLAGSDNFVDVLKRITEEHCAAHEHADLSYLAARVPSPEFTRNPNFNWLPQGSFKLDLSELDGTEHAITCSSMSFVHPMLRNLELDQEPTIQLYDAGDEIGGDMYFALDRFSAGTMERFCRNFLNFVEVLLTRPEQRVRDIMLS